MDVALTGPTIIKVTGCGALVKTDRNRLKPCRTSTLVAKTACLRSGDRKEMMRLRLFTVHQMALTERQQTAERLMRWLQGKGMNAFVTNPMPLDPGQPGLRFQVLNEDRDVVLSKLREQDWAPIFLSINLRVCVDGVLRPCTTYQLDLAREQPVAQDRIIRGDVVDPAKKAADKASIEEWHRSISGKRGK